MDVSFHGALVDYSLSTASGLPLWQHFQERHPYIPLILLTDETLWPQQAIDAAQLSRSGADLSWLRSRPDPGTRFDLELFDDLLEDL